MQVGVEQLARAQHLAFARLRLLDLDDHVGAGKDFFRRVDDGRAGLLVHLVGQADGLAAVALHDDVVTVMRQFACAGRREADAVFVILDFLGYADQHDCPPGAVNENVNAAAPYAVARIVSASVEKILSMCDLSRISGGLSAITSPVTRISRSFSWKQVVNTS